MNLYKVQPVFTSVKEVKKQADFIPAYYCVG